LPLPQTPDPIGNNQFVSGRDLWTQDDWRYLIAFLAFSFTREHNNGVGVDKNNPIT
jgi:hypothetical protein